MTHSDQSKPTTLNFHMLKVKTTYTTKLGEFTSTVTELETEHPINDNEYTLEHLSDLLLIH